MLKSVIIFWTHGNYIYSKTYEPSQKDLRLVSGFLAALNSFAKELGEKEIRSIIMHPHKIFMSIRQKLVFTLLLDQDDEEAHGTLILESLIQSFLAIYGKELDPSRPMDISIFKEFDPIPDSLNLIKNFFDLIESTNKIIVSLEDLQEMYETKFKEKIPLTKCWESVNFLVLHDVIVDVIDGYTIGYRKKGELLKGYSLRFKK